MNENENMIPKRLTWCELDANRSYELWRTPQVKPGWHLYYFEHGVEAGKHPFDGDIAARTGFERAVESDYDRTHPRSEKMKPNDEQPDEMLKATADPEYQTRIDAQRVTLEFRTRSRRPLDSGKAPITDGPLFGGPAQGELF